MLVDIIIGYNTDRLFPSAWYLEIDKLMYLW